MGAKWSKILLPIILICWLFLFLSEPDVAIAILIMMIFLAIALPLLAWARVFIKNCFEPHESSRDIRIFNPTFKKVYFCFIGVILIGIAAIFIFEILSILDSSTIYRFFGRYRRYRFF